VDEQRNGERGGMRHGLHFYARCAQEAWRRSWDAAKAWPPILALLVLYGGARLAGLDLSFPGDIEHGALIGTGLFIVVAWLAVFLVQLVAAPPRLYARLDAERLALARRPVARPVPLLEHRPAAPIVALPAPAAPAETPVVAAMPAPVAAAPAPEPQPEPPLALEPALQPAPPRPAPRPAPPPLDVRLHDQVYETTAADTTGELLPPSRAYVARVTNRGDTRLRRCQIFFGSPTHIQVVSGPFDLAPGDHRDLPVLRVIDESDEPHALLYFLDGETWAVAQGQAAWLPEPGRFKVKVLSANAPAAALDVTLACSEGTPLAWTLVEADAPEKAPAPKAGRRRRTWTAAAADVVAEPGPGD
jgi:hypothetical protein